MAYDIGPSIGVTGEKEFKAAMASINDEFKLLGSEMKLAVSQFDNNDKSTEALTAQNKVLGKEIDSQKGRIALLTTQYDKQNSTIATLKDKLAATKVAFSADSAEVAKAQKEYDKQNRTVMALQTQLNNATTGLNNMERALESNNQAIKENSGNMGEFGEKMKAMGAAAAIGVAAIGAAFVGIAAAGVAMSDDLQKALNGVQASTGTTDEAMGGMKDTMLAIYNNNFGDSFEDIGTTMGLVSQQTGLAGEALQKMTEGAFALRDTFEMDVAGSVETAGVMMKNFGIDSDAAFNLIAQGAQKGLNKQGDLLDILKEYGPHFASLGFSAEEAMNMLANGAAVGVFSVDQLGDVVHEFGRQMKESDMGEPLAALGLDATKYTQMVAAGGDQAKQAFQDITSKLANLDDKQVQTTVGLAVFGDMWGEVGAEGILAMNNIQGSISNTTDALGKINEVKYNTLGEAMEGIRRNLMTGLVLPIGEAILPALSKLGGWLQDNLPSIIATIKPILEGVGATFVFLADNAGLIIPVLAGVAAAFAAQKAVGAVTLLMDAYKAATVATTAVQWLLNAAMAANPFGAIALVIGVVVAAGIALWMNWDTIKEKLVALSGFLVDIWNGIKTAVVGVLSGLGSAITGAWDDIKTSTIGSVTSIGEGAVSAWEGMKTGLSGTMETIGSTVSGAWESIKGATTGACTSLANSATEKFSGMSSGISSITEGIKSFLGAAWEIIKTIVLAPVLLLCDLVTGDFEGLSTDAQAIFNKLKDAFAQIWGAIKLVFTGTVEAIKSFLDTSWDLIKSGAEEIWNGIKTYFATLWTTIKTTATGAWTEFKNSVTQGWRDTVQGAKDIWNGLLTWFSELPGKLRTTGASMFTSMKEGVSSTISGVKDAVVSGIQGAISYLTSLPGQAIKWGKDMIQGFIDGLRSMIGTLKGAVGEVASAIRSLLHFSVPDEGPLTDYESWMPDFMSGLAEGIQKSKHLVTDAVNSLASGMSIGVQGSMSGFSALNTNKSGSSSSSTNIIRHTGTIRVEGINNKGQLQDAVDIIIDKLQMEARMA